jgi:hypothetical protein
MTRAIPLLIAAALLTTACQATTGGGTTTAAPITTITTTCHAHSDHGQPLPDPTCTPGALNPNVTQADIHSTICKRGWTATIRPPASYTEPLKRRQIAQYGYSDRRLGSYEEDHLVALSLGGSPTDVRNLWPEPGASPNPKDGVESALNHAVCAGRVPLAAAQRAIATDWATAKQKLGIR